MLGNCQIYTSKRITATTALALYPGFISRIRSYEELGNEAKQPEHKSLVRGSSRRPCALYAYGSRTWPGYCSWLCKILSSALEPMWRRLPEVGSPVLLGAMFRHAVEADQ
jgi:hypothetical protein